MINGQVVGMDCFGKPDTFKKVFQKLVESYALDAIDPDMPDKGGAIDKSSVMNFLQSPTACRVEPHPAVGLGTDLRLESETTTGAALVHEDQILHLSAFARTAVNNEKPLARMMRASRRAGLRS